MKLASSIRDGLLVGAALFGLQFLQGRQVAHTLRDQDRLLTVRLHAALAGLLTQAHRAKDDLVIAQILNGLRRSPGILQAALISPGKPMTGTNGSAYPLKDGEQEWGRLLIRLSDYSRRRRAHQLSLSGMAGAAVLWVLFISYFQRMAREAAAVGGRAGELESLLHAERAKVKKLMAKEQSQARRETTALQRAVERVERPLIVLDSRQRLCAINRPGLLFFGVAEPDSVLGKSWNDVPVLLSCGGGLESSLAGPDRPVEYLVPGSDIKLELNTDAGGQGHTWIRLLNHPQKET